MSVALRASCCHWSRRHRDARPLSNSPAQPFLLSRKFYRRYLGHLDRAICDQLGEVSFCWPLHFGPVEIDVEHAAVILCAPGRRLAYTFRTFGNPIPLDVHSFPD